MSLVERLFSMNGKIALVTGAGTGIGRRFAETLAAAGARVICVARNRARLDQVVESIHAAGGSAHAITGDIGSVTSVEDVFNAAESVYGRVNVLVNCAAQVDFGVFPEVGEDAWNNLVNVNLSGLMRMCRSFSRRLIENKEPGSIINVTSITGTQVIVGMPGYCTLKAATTQLTRVMAADMFGHNIRVNAISPGYFKTEMASILFESEAGRAMIEKHPLKRLGNVEELDGPLLLLASDASSHINGSVITVDAGHSIQLH
jgi:NAD(P)-dependent dehydrogenase (short-subunit alcohol dehydrogenase family)